MKKTITQFILVTTLVPSLALGAENSGGIDCRGTPTNQERPFQPLENYFKGFPQISRSVGNDFRVAMANTALSTLKSLCQKKRTMDTLTAGFVAKAKDSSGCKFGKDSTEVKSLTAAAEAYSQALNDANLKYNEKFDSLWNQERLKIMRLSNPKNYLVPHEQAWGHDLVGTANQASQAKGFFSKIKLQLEKERQDIEKYLSPQKGMNAFLQQNDLNCPSLSGDEKLADGKLKAGGAKKDGDVDLDLPEKGPVVPEKPPQGDGIPVDPNATQQPPPDTEPPAQAGNGLGSWVSNHKGALLVGAGAAAVVGGVLLYKHNQDKKKEEAQDMEISALDGMASGSGGSTSTSTSSATQTVLAPAGATLQATGFPTQAIVNVPVSSISVRVVGADGALLADNGIEITLSCTSACGISGTLTKTTVGGLVEFGGIKFTNAGSGVQLRVSSPGINSVASPGSFPVSDPEY